MLLYAECMWLSLPNLAYLVGLCTTGGGAFAAFAQQPAGGGGFAAFASQPTGGGFAALGGAGMSGAMTPPAAPSGGSADMWKPRK